MCQVLYFADSDDANYVLGLTPPTPFLVAIPSFLLTHVEKGVTKVSFLVFFLAQR
jgi:hypothetical protein